MIFACPIRSRSSSSRTCRGGACRRVSSSSRRPATGRARSRWASTTRRISTGSTAFSEAWHRPGSPRTSCRDVEGRRPVVFSRRTPAPHELNRLARALGARTRPFLDLTATNPTSVALRSGEADLFDGARSGRDARVLAALADARGLVYTPDPKGILSAAVEAEVRRAEAAGHRVAAVVLVNPNNPTGTSLAGAELSTLFALAKERGFAVISDEVFVDFRSEERRVG